MKTEYIVLIVIIVSVVVIDLIQKKRSKSKSFEVIPKENKTKVNKISFFIYKVLLIGITLFIVLLTYMLYDSRVDDIPFNKLNFELIKSTISNNYKVVIEKNEDYDLKYLLFNSNYKKDSPYYTRSSQLLQVNEYGNRLEFGELSSFTIDKITDSKSGKINFTVDLIHPNHIISELIFRYFGRTKFWSKTIILETTLNRIELPLIEKVEIYGGKTIESSEFRYKPLNFHYKNIV